MNKEIQVYTDLTRYNALFSNREGANGFNPDLKYVIDNRILVDSKPYLWKRYFAKDETKTVSPLDPSKPASYASGEITAPLPVMFDLHVPGSEVSQSDKGGFSIKQGSIPTFARGVYEKALSMATLKALLSEYGNDKTIVDTYIETAASLIMGANTTLTNLATQIMSTGTLLLNRGQGAAPFDYGQLYPTKAFVTAGASVWSDTTANLVEIMVKHQNEMRDLTGYDGPLTWKIDDVTLAKMSQNALFIKLVNQFSATQNKSVVVINSSNELDTLPISKSQLIEWSKSEECPIAPIEEISEQQRVQNLTGKQNVRGWKEGNALLSPAGQQGIIKYSDCPEEGILKTSANDMLKWSSAKFLGGMGTIINKIAPVGELKEYHSNFYLSAIPTLFTWKVARIVDTTTAD